MSQTHNVFLGIPFGADGALSAPTHQAICKLGLNQANVQCSEQGSSALTMNFNTLWCEALNQRLGGAPIDVFAMIHTDIAPGHDDWMDRMLALFDRERADVLSVISPIKNHLGLTSTALDTCRFTPRRLTMTEVHQLPPTFNGDFIRGRYGAPLLLNTGLMLVRFTEPWALEVCFGIDNRIVRGPDGTYVALFEPEDWKFSRWCNARGLNLVATREIVLGHKGEALYRNDQAWGSMAVDSTNLTNGALAHEGLLDQK